MVWILAISAAIDQPRYFEQLIVRDILVPDYFLRLRGVSQAGVGFRLRRGLPAKCVHKVIVLAREDVVKKTQANVPIIGKSHGFLTGPLGVLRI